jgi:hypothetical protein
VIARAARGASVTAAVVAFVCLILLGSASAGCGSTGEATKRGDLRWAPPALSDPTTIKLGRNYSDVDLKPDQDYVLKLPAVDKHGGLTIEGGHNVTVIGGHITVPAGGPPGAANDRYRTGIYVKNSTGTVHIEGVLIDGAPGAEWDGVDIDAPRATVQLENLRVDGVRGRFSRFHGDVVQPWGGVHALRIDRLTASSNYQGVTIPIDEGRIGSAQISRVDLHGVASGIEKGGHLIWLTTGSETCDSYPVDLRHFYLEPRAGLDLGESVWPQVGRPRPCGARSRRGFAFWPRLADVHGGVHLGTPPDGPYVPRGVAGVDYVTPGYRDSGGS